MVNTNSIDSSLASKKSLTENILSKLGGRLLGLTILVITVCTGSFIYTDNTLLSESISNVLIGISIVFLCTSFVIDYLSKYPGNRPQSYLITTVAIFYVILLGFILFFRIEYSRFALLIALPILYCSLYLERKIQQQLFNGHYAVIPVGFYKPLLSANGEKFSVLQTPCTISSDIKGIIVDKNEKLDEECQRFIAHALSNDIPVLDTVIAYESITGKSPLNHYGEIATIEINPKKLTLLIKRIIESLLIVITAPLWLSIVGITAILIRIESTGPAFFIQKRVGRGGREFKMFKLRSMCLESEKNGAQFATEEDPRITRIGRIIRKTRIDELPQFVNILRGDMSLIGPRPEQASFVNKFENEIPLYSYRHVVRPGITGWAQVTQGYASTTDETREKLAHDFYYVKNLSLWLDLDIALKTIKTMLTGFGAR